MAGVDRAAHVLQHNVRGERALGAACPRDDAVGAVERAAVLHLHERARPLDRARSSAMPSMGLAASTPESVGAANAAARGARPRRSRGGRGASSPSSSAEEAPPSRRCPRGGRPGRARANVGRSTCDRAARHDDGASGFAPAGTPHGLAALLVGDRRHGARVDEVEVGRCPRRHDLDTGDPERTHHGVHLRLVHLASQIRDRGAAHPACHPRERRRPPRDRHRVRHRKPGWHGRHPTRRGARRPAPPSRPRLAPRDDETGLERRDHLGFAVDEDARGEERAARAQVRHEPGGELRRGATRSGWRARRRTGPPGRDGPCAGADPPASRLRRALAADASTAIGSTSTAEDSTDAPSSPAAIERIPDPHPTSSSRRPSADRREQGPSSASARAGEAQPGAWGGGPSRRPSRVESRGPRRGAPAVRVARWAG